MEQRMLFQPVSIDSSTHRALTKHIAKSWEGKSSKGGRSIIMTATTEAPELEKQKREKQWEEKRRLDLRQSSHRRSVGEYSSSGPTLSASFLEADEEEEGNLGAIKRRFKNQRSKARGGGSSGGGGGGRRKRPRLYRDDDEAEADESDDDDEERAWDAEERRAAATGEMDDFIAADDEAATALSSVPPAHPPSGSADLSSPRVGCRRMGASRRRTRMSLAPWTTTDVRCAAPVSPGCRSYPSLIYIKLKRKRLKKDKSTDNVCTVLYRYGNGSSRTWVGRYVTWLVPDFTLTR